MKKVTLISYCVFYSIGGNLFSDLESDASGHGAQKKQLLVLAY